jgi:membrane fusion protein (multidrug efflux system)
VSTIETAPAAPGGAASSRAPEPLKRSAMIKPIIIVVVLVVLLLAGITGSNIYFGMKKGKQMALAFSAPATVATATATNTEWQAQSQAVGSLRAAKGADLAPQASGVVDRISFESGNDVKKGDVLLRLRPNDDPAKLAQLQAAAVLADLTLKRDREQLAAQAISQATVDTDVSNLKSANAQVAAQQALMEEKIVRAPFAGRLGIRQIDEGQYLTAGTTVVTLQALDPIYVDFYVPQQMLAALKKGETVTASVDAYPGAKFAGTISAINSKVDSASRNVQVRASLPNADRRLVPGMYATVEINNGAARSLVTVPQTAISYNPYGDVVYVVEKGGNDDQGHPKLTVQQHFVKLGPTRGDQVAIESGVSAGDVVVTQGQMKLRNGAPVTINNSTTPSNDPAPTPPNE